MLPPGHIAAGFLVSSAVISSVPFEFTQTQEINLLLIGMFLAFAPDLDFFFAFAKAGRMRIENTKVNHRKLLTHVPLLWLLLGLGVYFTSDDAVVKTAGLLVWLCSWSHFVLDTEWGIMWFWPFSKKLLTKKDITMNPASPELGFFKYWTLFLKSYFKQQSSYFEILIIIIALVVAFKS